MDRPRSRDPRRVESEPEVLKRGALLLLALTACTDAFDFDRIVAIDIIGPTRPEVEEGDTIRLVARAINAAGDSVPDVDILWELLAPDTGVIAVSLDQSGLVTGLAADTARIQARYRTLIAGPIVVRVTALPDTVSSDSTRFIVPDSVQASGTLTVTVAAYPDTGSQLIPLSGKTVTFEVRDPAGGAGVTFQTLGGTATADPSIHTATTGGSGTVAVVLARGGGSQPDSAIVEAVGFTAAGVTVPGSPIRFVIIFQ